MKQLYRKRPLCFYILIFTICLLVIQIFSQTYEKESRRLAAGAGHETKATTAEELKIETKFEFEIESGLEMESEVRTESEVKTESTSKSKLDSSESIISLAGTIAKIEEKNGRQIIYLSKCYLSAKSAEQIKNKQLNIEALIRNEGVICYMKNDFEVKPGMTCEIEGKIRSFSHAENEGQFDAKNYYHSIGYEAMLYDSEIVFCGKQFDRVAEWLRLYKGNVRDFYYTFLPAEDASVLSAMLLGEKGGIEQEIKSLYQKNGIAHILAISGLHISMIGMGLYKILKKAFVPLPICSVCGITVILLYGKLVQGQSSLIRALCMYVLFLLADLLSQSYDMITAMAFSAAVVLLRQPANIYSSGFWMSYLAVIGIGVVSPILNDVAGQMLEQITLQMAELTGINLKIMRRDAFKKLISAFIASLSVQLVTLPVQLWFNYAFPPYAILLNLIIVPMLGIVIGSGVASGLFRIPLFLLPARFVLSGYKWICIRMQSFPGYTIITGKPFTLQVVAYYLLLTLWLIVLTRNTNKKTDKKKDETTDIMPFVDRKTKLVGVRIIKMLTPVLACMILIVSFRRNDVVDFLSVGQGDCAVIRTKQGECVLVDAGSSTENEAGTYKLIPFLKYNGVNAVDVIFVSHAHEDHISAILELLEQKDEEGIEVGAVALSEYAKEDLKYDLIREGAKRAGVPVLYLKPMQTLTVGEAHFLCLSPDVGIKPQDENDESMTLCLKLKGTNYLFTGDLTQNSEEMVLNCLSQAGVSKIDCLKVAHHGARTSTSDRFLGAIKPDFAVISCGRNNRYGHPHSETIKRLEKRNVGVFVTSQIGQVRTLPK